MLQSGTRLDEGLDLGPTSETGLAHPLCRLARVALDASDDGVRVGSLLGALIELLDHNDLLASLPPLQHNRHLAGLVDYIKDH